MLSEFVNHPPLRPLQLVLVRLLHVVVAHFLEACEFVKRSQKTYFLFSNLLALLSLSLSKL